MLELETAPTFASSEEEAKYWKHQALECQKKLHEMKEELELREYSRELEAELEVQLEHTEKKNRELQAANTRLQLEYDTLKEKLEKSQSENYRQITELQEELQQTTSAKDRLQKYIRELEQANDDLERAKRATVVSLEDFEGRLNQAIERNAFLESELDDKEALATTVQRLRDESRDLRSELQIRGRPVTSPEQPDNDKRCSASGLAIDSNKLRNEVEVQTTPGSPLRSFSAMNGTPLTPSARISALNIVSDLLRKVGALESKLASCKSYVKDTPRTHGNIASPNNSPRAKRMNRGALPSSSPGAGKILA